MTELNQIYLSIGSNISPEFHLPRAIALLGEDCLMERVSTVWETRPVGTEGPNFLNACALLFSPSTIGELKVRVLYPIEAALGRVRSQDKNAPRTIDLDIVMQGKQPVNLEKWNFAFVIVPMAELVPNLLHPITHEKLSLVAEQKRADTWMRKRPEILTGIHKTL